MTEFINHQILLWPAQHTTSTTLGWKL